jgi:hypothetical protein
MLGIIASLVFIGMQLKQTDFRDIIPEYVINAFAGNIHRYPGFAAANRSQLA